MQFSKYIFLIIAISIFTIPLFSQIEQSANNRALTITDNRIALIKTDIIKEITSFSPAEQSVYYAQFGEMLWESDQKEARTWFNKSVELALSPAASYNDDIAKIFGLISIYNRLEQKEPLLANKLFSKITALLIETANTNNVNNRLNLYFHLAYEIVDKDENLAFELVKTALKDRNFNFSGYNFYYPINIIKKNKTIGNYLISNLIEKAKNEKNSHLAFILGYYIFEKTVVDDDDNPVNKKTITIFSDKQRQNLLEVFLHFIQKDSLELQAKQRTDCGSIVTLGFEYLPLYKKLLPEKNFIVENALNVCQNAEIKRWEKPDFLLKKTKTSQDYLDIANESVDKKIKNRYLQTASRVAEYENNFPLAVSILDSIEKEYRQEDWIFSKVQLLSNYIEFLIKQNNFNEINKVLNNTPIDYRPYVINESLYSFSFYEPIHRQFAIDFMNIARAYFNKIEKFPADKPTYVQNPTKFADLTLFYVKAGLFEDAVEVHEESIKLLNRLLANLPPELKDKPIYLQSSYTVFTNQYPPNDTEFFNKYFDRLYKNIGMIEAKKIRLSSRFDFLKKNLVKLQPTQSIPGFPS